MATEFGCFGRANNAQVQIASMRVTFRTNLYADLCLGTILALKDQCVVTQETGPWLPVEYAARDARSDGQWGAMALYELVAGDCAEWDFDATEFFDFDWIWIVTGKPLPYGHRLSRDR
jgi:hypothetical protein